jgi:hypothetical protein
MRGRVSGAFWKFGRGKVRGGEFLTGPAGEFEANDADSGPCPPVVAGA